MSPPKPTRRSLTPEATLIDAQQKVRHAISGGSYSATSEQMQEISQMTHDSPIVCTGISDYLLTALLTPEQETLKCLILLEYLLRTGPVQLVIYFRVCHDVLAGFKEFAWSDVAVQEKAATVCHLLQLRVLDNTQDEDSTGDGGGEDRSTACRARTVRNNTCDEAYYRASLTVRDLSQEISSFPLHPSKSSGFADVYLCDWITQSGKKHVGVKIIRAAEMQMTQSLHRKILREIEVWHRAKHPNIHPLLGLYYGRGQLPAMVSPWCKNGDIPQYLRAMRGHPDIDRIKLRLMEEVLQGLKYMHDSQPPVVHGDIKGANVLISDDGVACLCDFGLATVKSDHSNQPADTIKGTVRWMAPELFEADSTRYTTYSDIWAVGCLLFEIQSERVPYYNYDNLNAVILALGRYETPARPVGIPDRLWWLMHECCALKPQERPSIDHVIARMRGLVSWFSSAKHQWHEPSLPAGPDEYPPAVALRLLTRSAQTAAGPPPWQMDDSLLQAAFVLFTFGRRFIPPNMPLIPILCSVLATCVQRALEREHDVLMVPLVRAAIGHVQLLPSVEKKALKELLRRSQRPAREIRRLSTAVARVCMTDAQWVMSWLSCRLVGRAGIGHTEQVTCTVFVPNSKRLVTGSFDGTICICDFVLGSLLLGPLLAGSPVTTLSLSKDGRRLASGTSSGTFRVWRTDTGDTVCGEIHGHTQPITFLAFSSDGTHIASRSEKDGAICIWHVSSGRLIVGPFRHEPDNRPLYNLPPPIAFAEEGQRILVALYPGNKQSVYHFRTDLPSAADRTDGAVGSCAGAPDNWVGKFRMSLASRVRRPGAQEAKGSIRHLRDVDAHPHIPWSVLEYHSSTYTPPGLNPYPLPLSQPRQRPGELVLSPSGRLLAVVDEADGTISVWDAQTMTRLISRIATFEGCMAFSPDSRYLASASTSEDGRVVVWDLTDDWRQV